MEYCKQPHWQVKTLFYHCPDPTNAIAVQLPRNGKYEKADRESTRLISKEVSDRWTLTATPANIFGDFTAAEFAAALQNTKPGKALGPDSLYV